MNKIRFFFLQVLFLCTPLIYAWLYVPYVQGNLADIAQPILLNINHNFQAIVLFLAFFAKPFLSFPFISSLFLHTFTEVHWS